MLPYTSKRMPRRQGGSYPQVVLEEDPIESRPIPAISRPKQLRPEAGLRVQKGIQGGKGEKPIGVGGQKSVVLDFPHIDARLERVSPARVGQYIINLEYVEEPRVRKELERTEAH